MVGGRCCPRGDTPLDAVFFRLGAPFLHGRGVHASYHLQGGCFRSTSFSFHATMRCSPAVRGQDRRPDVRERLDVAAGRRPPDLNQRPGDVSRV